VTIPFKPQEKWDVHTHTTLSPATYESLARFDRYADFIRVRAHKTKPCCAEMVNKGEVQRVIENNAYDGTARAEECEKHGVTMQVLSPTPMMIPDTVENAADAAEICKILNDDNAAMVNGFPTRFTALAALPMRDTKFAIQELERAKTLGMRGVEINSNIDGADLDDPRFYPIFEAALALDMAIFIHPCDGFMAPTEERLKKRMHHSYNWRTLLIGMGMETALAFDAMRSGGVHERLPKLRVLYAHGGGAFPALLGRLEQGAYGRPDLFRNASRKNSYQTVHDCAVYADSLTHDPFVLAMLIDALGTSRLAMGSDYPYPLGEIEPFDAKTRQDAKGNQCPYGTVKGTYPGYMIEHLPETKDDMQAAWKHFHWLPKTNADGARDLPCLTHAQKQRMLSGTAKEWLGWK
jgi:aminocarboxymuconate-semialdehyde decarboxylase